MAEDSSVDEVALVGLVERLVGAGVHGLIPCASTGEVATLTGDERRRLLELVIATSGGRTPVIAQTGAVSAQEALELSIHAQEAGAAALMVGLPAASLTHAEITAYYETVTAGVSIPVGLYKPPIVLGNDLKPAQVAKLAAIEGVAFFKESDGDGFALAELVTRHSARVQTFSSWDSLMLSAFALGAEGTISGVVNIVPDRCVALWDAVTWGDLPSARAVWSTIWPLCKHLELHPYVATLKAASEMAGYPLGSPRLPLLPLAEDSRADLQETARDLGLGRPQTSSNGGADISRAIDAEAI